MVIGFELKRLWSIALFSVALVALFTSTLFAGERENITWSTILPEENNLSLQQQKVMNSFEITLKELDSVIDKEIQNRKIDSDSDFTLNEDVSLVYDFLMYRIFELIKVDRKIKEEFAAQEASLKNRDASYDMLRQYYNIKEDYEKKGLSFFSTLEGLKRALSVKNLKAEIKNLQASIMDLRSAMNLYSTYKIAIAAR